MSEGPRTGHVHRPRATAAHVAAVAAGLLAVAIAGCGGGGSENSTGTSASVGTPPSTKATSPTKATTTDAGGGSSGGQGGQRLTIPAVVEAVLTSSDPAKTCGSDYVTQHYLSSAYGGEQGCVQAQSPKNAAASVLVGPVTQTSTQPRAATAKASPKGGLYDGEKLTVSLVQEGGSWKIDGLKSNVPVGP